MKLNIIDEDYEKIKNELHSHGIETDDNAELVLSKAGTFADKLIIKDIPSSERVIVNCNDIIYFESYGHCVNVHTVKNTYSVNERLYKISLQLDKLKFLRISNSVIVAKSHIRKITPTLSMKFILTLSDGSRVDVTRSYYYSFKEAFNF